MFSPISFLKNFSREALLMGRITAITARNDLHE